MIDFRLAFAIGTLFYVSAVPDYFESVRNELSVANKEMYNPDVVEALTALEKVTSGAGSFEAPLMEGFSKVFEFAKENLNRDDQLKLDAAHVLILSKINKIGVSISQLHKTVDLDFAKLDYHHQISDPLNSYSTKLNRCTKDYKCYADVKLNCEGQQSDALQILKIIHNRTGANCHIPSPEQLVMEKSVRGWFDVIEQIKNKKPFSQERYEHLKQRILTLSLKETDSRRFQEIQAMAAAKAERKSLNYEYMMQQLEEIASTKERTRDLEICYGEIVAKNNNYHYVPISEFGQLILLQTWRAYQLSIVCANTKIDPQEYMNAARKTANEITMDLKKYVTGALKQSWPGVHKNRSMSIVKNYANKKWDDNKKLKQVAEEIEQELEQIGERSYDYVVLVTPYDPKWYFLHFNCKKKSCVYFKDSGVEVIITRINVTEYDLNWETTANQYLSYNATFHSLLENKWKTSWDAVTKEFIQNNEYQTFGSKIMFGYYKMGFEYPLYYGLAYNMIFQNKPLLQEFHTFYASDWGLTNDRWASFLFVSM